MLESTDVIPFTACLRNWQCLILSTEGHWCPSFSVTLYCSQSMTPLQQLMCANPRLYICVCLCVSVCILAQPLLTSVCSLLFSRHTLHLSLSHSPSMSLSLSLCSASFTAWWLLFLTQTQCWYSDTAEQPCKSPGAEREEEREREKEWEIYRERWENSRLAEWTTEVETARELREEKGMRVTDKEEKQGRRKRAESKSEGER